MNNSPTPFPIASGAIGTEMPQVLSASGASPDVVISGILLGLALIVIGGAALLSVRKRS